MTEVPMMPMEAGPASPPPVPPNRSRRRLIIGLAAGLVAAVVIVVGALVALNVLNARATVLYTSEAENYSVMAPGEPTQEEAVVVEPLAIPATATHWTDGARYYAVSSADGEDLPPTPVWRGMFLHDLLVGALRDAPGVSASSLETSAVTDAFLTEPDEITLSGDPAYGFTITIEGAPAPFHVVFAGHGTRLYMVVFSDAADGDGDEFLDSFAFLD